MARRYGNANQSSLVKTAQTMYAKNQAYDDQVAAYEYGKSDAQIEDFNGYADRLNKRIAQLKTSDPSKALSLQSTLDSAYRRYNSAEISRATLAVNYGDISNRDKYQRLMGLYQNAVSIGDDALASRLESNLASLSVTIQNEDTAAAGRASAASSKAAAKEYSDSKKEFSTALKAYDDQLQSGKMDAREYASKVGQVYQAQAQFYSSAADAGNESAVGDYNSLMVNDTYKKFTSPQMQEEISRMNKSGKGAAEDPLAIKYDQYGRTSLVDRKPTETTGMLGPDGKPLDINQHMYATGLIGDNMMERQRKVSIDPASNTSFIQSPLNTIKTELKGSKDGIKTGIDPITHATIGFAPDEAVDKFPGGRANFAITPGTNYTHVFTPQERADYENNAKALLSDNGDLSAAGKRAYNKAYNPFDPRQMYETDKQLVDNIIHTPVAQEVTDEAKKAGSLGKKLVGAVVNPGAALGKIANMISFGNMKEKERQAAELQRQQAIAAQQRAVRDAAAAQAAREAANAAAARKNPSVLYTQPAQPKIGTAEAFAQGSGGKTDDASLAKGIASSIGYKIPKL